MRNFDKMSKALGSANFNENFEIRERFTFSGLFWPGYFSPSFRLWIPKRCKGVHCVDLGESFPGDAENKEGKRSAQREVTPELFLSCGGELRDVEEEFSECVRYCYVYLSTFPFFSFFPCPFVSIFFSIKIR